MSKKKDSFYILTYRDPKEGKILSLKAKNISDSSLGLSFVSISDFIFDTEGLVINPNEENAKKRFENIRSFHLSIYSILSIEEVGVEHNGLNFKKDKSNLFVLPGNSPSSK